MGIREALRSLRRQVHEDMDYLLLKDGSRFYFDPERDLQELFFELIRKGTTSKKVETPKIREALVRATPESLARFEEKYFPVTQEVGVGYAEERQVVRRVELDGTVRNFLVEGEAGAPPPGGSRLVIEALRLVTSTEGLSLAHSPSPIASGPAVSRCVERV